MLFGPKQQNWWILQCICYLERNLVMSDPSDNQLKNYAQKNGTAPILTTSTGAPIHQKKAVLTAGPRGPMLLQDVVYLNEMQHFDRERIPERVVHAKGAGAHGFFEVTHDISKYSRASVFSQVGKQTPVFLRFSTVGGEMGSADTVRDPRGFALKFYTEEGNWDLVGNNTPIFFIRDPIFFPSLIHAVKRNPQTNLKDHNAVFDFWGARQEAIHQIMFLFGDRGIPDGFRHMTGHGSHTFKMVNKEGEATWVKFHFKPLQGVRNLCPQKAKELTASDPDYSTRDLYNAIERGDHPKWQMNIQVMTLAEADKSPFNPFDVTKVWPHEQYPLIPVGTLTLNRNPRNYFAEVEQVAFCPAHTVPGIELSPDRMLQGRSFSYTDTHFHRLGPNYQQLPINCPFRTKAHNYQRGGLMTIDSQGDAPIYHPNSFNGPKEPECPHAKEHVFALNGNVDRYDDGNVNNFEQPRQFWTKILCEEARERLVCNLADPLSKCETFIIDRFINNAAQVHADFGSRLRSKVDSMRCPGKPHL